VPSRLCKVPIDGGEPIVLATGPWTVQDVSPIDGRIVYADFPSDNKGSRNVVKIMSPTDASMIKILELPASSRGGQVRWSSDGRYLTFCDRGKNRSDDTIRAITLKGKVLPKPLFVPTVRIGNFEWSRDGKQIAYVRGMITSDAVLITKKAN